MCSSPQLVSIRLKIKYNKLMLIERIARCYTWSFNITLKTKKYSILTSCRCFVKLHWCLTLYAFVISQNNLDKIYCTNINIFDAYCIHQGQIAKILFHDKSCLGRKWQYLMLVYLESVHSGKVIFTTFQSIWEIFLCT